MRRKEAIQTAAQCGEPNYPRQPVRGPSSGIVQQERVYNVRPNLARLITALVVTATCVARLWMLGLASSIGIWILQLDLVAGSGIWI